MTTGKKVERTICISVILGIMGMVGKMSLDVIGYSVANVFWVIVGMFALLFLAAASYCSTPAYLASEIRKEIRQSRSPRSHHR